MASLKQKVLTSDVFNTFAKMRGKVGSCPVNMSRLSEIKKLDRTIDRCDIELARCIIASKLNLQKF